MAENSKKGVERPQYKFNYNKVFTTFVKRLFFDEDLSPEEQLALKTFNTPAFENVLIEVFRRLKHDEREEFIAKCSTIRENQNIYFCEGLNQPHGWMYDFDGLTLNCAMKGCNEYLCIHHYNRMLKRGVNNKPKDDDPDWYCKRHKVRREE